MPLPGSQLTNIEVITNCTIAAAGSNVRPTQLVTHWRRIATAVDTTKTSIDTAYQTAIVVPVMAALNLSSTQVNNTVRWINDPLDAPVAFTHAVVGAITGDRMAPQNAAFLLLRTGLKGRSYRGSKHLGPMSESDSTVGSDDLFNAGCLTRLNAVATAVLAGFTDGTGNVWKPSVVSRVLCNFLISPCNIVANDATSVTVKKTIGTMIHRKVKSVY